MSRLRFAVISGLAVLVISGGLMSPVFAATSSSGTGLGSFGTQSAGTPQLNSKLQAPSTVTPTITVNGQQTQALGLQPSLTAGIGSNAGTTGVATPAINSSGACSFSILSIFNPLALVACILQGMIGGIISILISLSVMLVTFAVNVNYIIGTSGGIAGSGWAYSLGLTDYLFVIGLVAIAFGTMLRRSFGKEILPKFIIVALLISFSFFIAMLFVNASNAVTNAFISTVPSDAWNSLGTAFNTSVSGNPISAYFLTIANSFAALFFTIIFGLVAVVTLVATAAMFLYRYVALTILLILLPFACFLSIFPIKAAGAGGLWEKWVTEFTRWIIFGPVIGFFIVLAFGVMNAAPLNISGVTGLFASVGNMIATIGLLLGGLYAANSLGIAGASYAYGFAKDKIAVGIPKAIGGAAGKWVSDRVVTSQGTNIANTMSKIPFLRATGEQIAARQAAIRKEAETHMASLGNLSDEALTARVKASNPAIDGPALTTALLNKAAQRGLFEEGKEQFDQKKMRSMMDTAYSVGKVDDFLNARPDMASEFYENIPDVVKKIPDASKINVAAFTKHPEQGRSVAAALGEAGIKKISENGKPALISALKNTLSEAVNDKASYQKVTDYASTEAKKETDEIASGVFGEFKMQNPDTTVKAPEDMTAFQIVETLSARAKKIDKAIDDAKLARNPSLVDVNKTLKDSTQDDIRKVTGRLNEEELNILDARNYIKDKVVFARGKTRRSNNK